jgi:hypothetical protein
MNREAESRLVDFCVAQRSGFDARAWTRFTGVRQLELAATARYLAGVSWYGHQDGLREVAGRLSSRSYGELAGEVGFDASRFGGRLKAHLRHAGQVFSG